MMTAQKVLHHRLIHTYPVFSSKLTGMGGGEPKYDHIKDHIKTD